MKTRITLSTLIIALIGSFQAYAQDYCIPPGFKDMGGVGEPFTHISNVQLEGLNNSSSMPSGVGEDNGYMYYENAATPTLQQGNTYSLKITAVDALGQGMEIAVWIDWNGDKEFDNISEKVAYWAPDGNHASDITVPSSIADGVIRMRVACDMPPSMGHIPLEPCGYLDYPSHAIGQHGEVEDYDIQIGVATGINDSNDQADFKIFPNPANEILNIDYPIAETTNYSVVDMYGRKLLQGQLNNGLQTIDISELSTGQYILMIEGTKSSVHRPFYVSR